MKIWKNNSVSCEIFKSKRMCFFAGFESNREYVNNSEVRKQTEMPKSKESLPLEERARSASRQVRECGNTTYKMVLDLTDTLSPEEAEKIKTEAQVKIQKVFNESALARIEREIGGEKENCRTLLRTGSAELETATNIAMKQYPMPDSFAEKGGTLEEWNNLNPEIQEYEIHGGMEVEYDPTELLLGGLGKMAVTAGVKGISLVLTKGKAFLSGIAEELVPISMKDALDFVRYAKRKTEGWVKTMKDLREEMMSPIGRTNEGFNMPVTQDGTQLNMVASKKDGLRRGPVAQHRIERADILARMEPLDKNMNELKKKLDEIALADQETKNVLITQASIIAKKLVYNSDNLVQRFTGFHTEILKNKYDPEGVTEIVEGFRQTGRRLDEISIMLAKDALNSNKNITGPFHDIKELHNQLANEFYNSL